MNYRRLLQPKRPFLLIALLFGLSFSIAAQTNVNLPDCDNCGNTSGTGFTIGKVCPLMLDIQAWSTMNGHNQLGTEPFIFVTASGELWGFGSNTTSGLGYSGYSQALGVGIDRARVSNVYSPSPLAAVYRQGLTKTWKDVLYTYFGWALSTDGEIWTWGENSQRTTVAAQGGDPPTGQDRWDAWQIPAPSGLSGFSQIYNPTDKGNDAMFARGNDGRLYSWGDGPRAFNLAQGPWTGSGPLITVTAPALASEIPHTILDSKFAVGVDSRGIVYIDENGDTYTWGSALQGTSGTADPPVLLSLPSGVKGVKLTGGRLADASYILLGDNGKLYFQTTGTSSFPDRNSFNIGPSSQTPNTWIQFDPIGGNATYVDVAANGTGNGNQFGYAVADDGTVVYLSLVNTVIMQ